jgi:hypothetical protein
MSDNKFTESMEVIEIGTMRLCDSVPVCANFTDVTGVLIEGITKDAAKLLYEKVEIMPVGTKAKMAELEASNKEMLAELESKMRLCRDRIYHSCDGCVLNESCSLRKAIDRAKVGQWGGNVQSAEEK